MTQVITDDLLEDHLRCHSKPYLRFHGQPGQMTAYSNLCVQLDAHNRAKALAWLMAKSKTEAVKCCNGLPLNDLATGDAIILDAVGRAQGLQSNFHALQRVSGVSDLGPFFYQPIRIFRHRQPTSAFRLLLAFDAMILSHLQGLTPKHGVLICGPLFKHVRVPLEAHLDALATVLRRLQLQLANVEEPPLALNPHCELCEFQQVCRAKAEAADNLTILKGMTLKEMARHNSKGIFTVKQLSYTFRSRRHAKRQSPRFPHHFSLQARAIRENKVHVHGDPNLTLSQTQVYLDIEGLPDRGFYYLIGALVVCGQSQVYHRFWADEESQQAAIFAQLAELESATNNAQLFHYGNYDINAVRRMLPYMPASYQKPLRAMLVNSINILSIVSSHVYFPTASNGLKDIAGFFGLPLVQR